MGPDGTVYVTDTAGSGSLPGQVYGVKGGAATPLGPAIVPGTPAGVAVTLDGSRLLASALDHNAGTSQVEVILTSNAASATYSDVIGENTFSGGIHRARTQDIYAWAGKTAVYAIRIQPINIASSTIGGVGVD